MAMHNREHVVLIRPAKAGLLLHTLYYSDELNSANRRESSRAKFTAKELDLAKNLVGQMTGAFRPGEFHDAYQKVTPVNQPRKAPVIDLMEALKRSLKSGASQPSSAKKPAQRRRAA